MLFERTLYRIGMVLPPG